MKFIQNFNKVEPEIFFISDPHYGHKNICRGVSNWTSSDLTRDFNTLEEMNSKIIDNINNVVSENDILFCLGDWSFGGIENIWNFRKHINCKNIHLILGNHDHHIKNNKLLPNCNFSFVDGRIKFNNETSDSSQSFGSHAKEIFSSVNQYLEINVSVEEFFKLPKKEYNFVLFHYPIASWINMDRGWIHLHGHTHLPNDKKMSGGKSIDVGLDGNNLMPYSIKDIIKLIGNNPNKKLSLPVDHHEREL